MYRRMADASAAQHERDATRAICDHLRGRVPAILQQLTALAHEESWLGVPPEDHLDALPELILGLVEAAVCEPRDLAARRACLWAAAEHGAVRRAQCTGHEVVFGEYHLLRRVLWQHLAAVETPPARDAATAAILRIDAAIAVATRASLLGYYRPEMQANGEWPARLETLVEDPEFVLRPRAPRVAP